MRVRAPIRQRNAVVANQSTHTPPQFCPSRSFQLDRCPPSLPFRRRVHTNTVCCVFVDDVRKPSDKKQLLLLKTNTTITHTNAEDGMSMPSLTSTGGVRSRRLGDGPTRSRRPRPATIEQARDEEARWLRRQAIREEKEKLIQQADAKRFIKEKLWGDKSSQLDRCVRQRHGV
jgi:hypothetical protein